MSTLRPSRSSPEFLQRKSDMNLPELTEAPMISEAVRQDSPGDLQCSHERLCEHLADLKLRNKELETYDHMLAHDLKDPLTIMIAAADLITHERYGEDYRYG